MYLSKWLKDLIKSPERAFTAVFLALTLCICASPLLLTVFGVGPGSYAKEKPAEKPILSENGKINIDYLSEFGDFYSESFAGRNKLLSLNNSVKSRLFMTSEVGGVVAGSDGWLYYRDTLNDWQGSNLLSDRQIFNIAENLSIMQRFVSESDAQFVFTIAPNKNSLYGENMPYYYPGGRENGSNAERLAAELAKKGVNYLNLFSLFENEDETLYLKNDSHWSNKGAVLVANSVFENIGREDALYDPNAYQMRDYPAGDLYQMLCPDGDLTEPNQNYDYDGELFTYEYAREGAGVEDAVINTACEEGTGSLVMYRDSFGNSLLPFFAGRYSQAAFYKTQPYNIELHSLAAAPDTVMVEKVERSLDELQLLPPILTAPLVDTAEYSELESTTEIICEHPEENTMFFRLCGALDESVLEDTSEVFVELNYGDYSEWRQAFAVTLENGGQGYIAYLPTYELGGLSVRTNIIVTTASGYLSVAESIVDFPELDFELFE